MLDLENMLQFFKNQLPAGVTYFSIAYAIFHFFGRKIIDNRFAIKLASAKAEFDKKLDFERDRLSRLTAYDLKLKEKEFAVLPKILNKINNLINLIEDLIFLADFDNADAVDDLFQTENNNVLGIESNNIENANTEKYIGTGVRYNNKTNEYLHNAKHRLTQLRRYFLKNRVFLRPEQKEKIEEIISLLAFVTNNLDTYMNIIQFIYGENLLYSAGYKIDKEVRPKMAEIEALVQKMIFPESKG